MTDEEIQQGADAALDERCRLLGTPIPPFTLAKRALRGRRWTPREARELRQLVDAGTLV